jgi:ADP-dependent NAD(P)H-hydrate dehydratase
MRKISEPLVLNLIPKRKKNSNKTDFGSALIIGGAKGLYGAGVLSALAATKSGCGYTHLMTDLSKFNFLRFPDFIVHPLKLNELKKMKNHALAIGPGLGQNKDKEKFLKYLFKNKVENVVVDADGLNLIAKLNLHPLPESWILTPHEGELARLLQTSSKKIKEHRKENLYRAQNKYQCHIILKGAETLMLDSKGNLFMTNVGTTALAKAGTGDVLLGILVALKAQKLSSKDAMIVATYIHGWCARLWEMEGNNSRSLRPLDIIERLSKFPDSRS